MSKKGIISSILIAAVVCIGIIIIKSDQKKIIIEKETNKTETTEESEVVEKNVQVGDLHSDILRAIAAGKDAVCGISPEAAEKELSSRIGKDIAVDKVPTKVKNLPFEIVSLIAKSPATIAGIKPKTAGNEIVKRYLSIELTDSEDVNSSILLEALQRRGEKEAIEKWADNEDAEAVEAFMKEEADRDPQSVANFAYGLKHLDDNSEEAKTYMDRYANHAHSDAFDNKNEEESNKVLIDAIKKLK